MKLVIHLKVLLILLTSFVKFLVATDSYSKNILAPTETVKREPQYHRYNYVHPPGGWIYYFCFFRRPMSGVTHGFRSFKGKVLELLSPNLVCRLIGSVACLGLLLAVVPLLLTE